MTRIAIAALAIMLTGTAHAQVYKCPDASGRTVIQQLPCDGGEQLKARPAPTDLAPPAPQNGDLIPMTNAERINAATEASQRERRRRRLQQFQVPRARAAIADNRDQCARQEAQLQDDQYRYVQNLYGKTHAAQRASELAALSAQCDTQDRALVSDYEALLAECQELDGCAGMR